MENGPVITAPRPAGTADTVGRILLAAEEAFVADGFHMATMDAIARRAGCSKRTIYKLFASKEDLFFGLLEREEAHFGTAVIDRTLPPRDALVAFLKEFTAFALAPRTIGILRMMMAEHTHSPALLATAEQRSRLPALNALEGYLAELGRRGTHDIGEPRQATQLLMGMAVGAFHHELLIGLAASFPPEVVHDRITRAVEIYLRGTAAPRP